ncbi:hypothetical protein Angca_001073, partial [Angiostrongylus cantonensis]
MSSVIRRIRRSNKKAAKYRFTATLEELLIVASDKWKPSTVVVSFMHRDTWMAAPIGCAGPSIISSLFRSFADLAIVVSWIPGISWAKVCTRSLPPQAVAAHVDQREIYHHATLIPG